MRLELERPAAEVERPPLLDRLVRRHEPAGRPTAGPGLAHERGGVALRPVRQRRRQPGMGDDRRARLAEDLGAEDVVGVHVRQDEPADRQRRPLADRRVECLADRARPTGVDHRHRLLADDEADVGDGRRGSRGRPARAGPGARTRPGRSRTTGAGRSRPRCGAQRAPARRSPGRAATHASARASTQARCWASSGSRRPRPVRQADLDQELDHAAPPRKVAFPLPLPSATLSPQSQHRRRADVQSGPVAAAVAALAALPPPPMTEGSRARSQPSASWEQIRGDVVGEGEILDGAALYAFEAPFRAEDAATVPMRITQAPARPDVRRLILVVDENPAPVAAEFSFGPAMRRSTSRPGCGSTPTPTCARSSRRWTATRYMTGRFVRASGGCSAPASKDAAAALAALGQMKMRWFEDGDGAGAGARRRSCCAIPTTPGCSATRSPTSSSPRSSSTAWRCARGTSCCSP